MRETLLRMPLSATDRVLDVGCGTGVLLQALAYRYPRAMLIGLDPVPGMLAVARARLPSAVALQQGQAEALPFTDECFDAIVSSSVFHYIRHPIAALAEMRRVLRPGGRVVITDWCGDYLSCRILDGYLRLSSAAHYRTWQRHELFELLAASGFVQINIERYRINWLWGLMTAAATREE